MQEQPTPSLIDPQGRSKIKQYLSKCRRRRHTLFCKLDDFRNDFDAKVLTIIQVNSRYYIYTSDPDWHPSLVDIKHNVYPLPLEYTPGRIRTKKL